MDHATLSAQSMPVKTPVLGQNGWERLPITWRNQPIYVHLGDGSWAYECPAEGRLVEMPEAVVEAIIDVRLLDWAYNELSPAGREALRGRSN